MNAPAPTPSPPVAPAPYVLVHRHDKLSLATHQLLLSPEEAPAFADAVTLAEALSSLHASEQARVAAAQQAGHAAGLARGRAEGQAQALQKVAQDLAGCLQRLERGTQAETAALQDSVVALALLVVRRVAADLGPETVLLALARRAFDHLASSGPRPAHAVRTEGSPSLGDADAGPALQGCTLRLNPDLLAALRQPLAQLAPGVRLLADDSLEPMDCVLDTPGGRLLAGLETQLTRVQAGLSGQDPAARGQPGHAVHASIADTRHQAGR